MLIFKDIKQFIQTFPIMCSEMIFWKKTNWIECTIKEFSHFYGSFILFHEYSA